MRVLSPNYQQGTRVYARDDSARQIARYLVAMPCYTARAGGGVIWTEGSRHFLRSFMGQNDPWASSDGR